MNIVRSDDFAQIPAEIGYTPTAQPAGLAAAARRSNQVLVVEDAPVLARHLAPVCEFLGADIRAIPSDVDLGAALEDYRPMAVIAPFECTHLDGGHVLKAVARHDASLPVMILVGPNPAWLGAVDALVDLLGLEAARGVAGAPAMGEIVQFLAQASQHARCRRASRRP